MTAPVRHASAGGDHRVRHRQEQGRPGRIHLGAGDDTYVDRQVDGSRDEIRCGPGDEFVGYWGDPAPVDTLHGRERVGNIAH